MFLILTRFLIDRLRLLWVQRRRRVLRQEVGRWPRVYADKYGFMVEGGYFEPQARHNAYKLGQTVFWVAWFIQMLVNWPGFLFEGGYEPGEIAAFLIGLGLASGWNALFPAIAFGVLALALSHKNLDVRLYRDGAIDVNGRRVAAAGHPRAFVVIQHEAAQKEARAESMHYRKNPKGEEFRTDFRDGSQVLILTGFSGMHRRAVAALENDMHQHWGNILRSTLEELDRMIQALPAEARIMPRTPLQAALHSGRVAAVWSMRQGWRGVRSLSGAAFWQARRAIAARVAARSNGRGRVPAAANARRRDQP